MKPLVLEKVTLLTKFELTSSSPEPTSGVSPEPDRIKTNGLAGNNNNVIETLTLSYRWSACGSSKGLGDQGIRD